MTKLGGMFFVLFLALLSTAAQDNPSNDEFAPLVLVRIIPMSDAQGRFDPMGVDSKTGNRIFAAVYRNDSVEVLEVQRGKRVHSIHEGFSKPQMVAHLPDLNRIVVSNEGDRACKVLDAVPSSIGARTGFYFPTRDTDRLYVAVPSHPGKVQNCGFMRYRIEY